MLHDVNNLHRVVGDLMSDLVRQSETTTVSGWSAQVQGTLLDHRVSVQVLCDFRFRGATCLGTQIPTPMEEVFGTCCVMYMLYSHLLYLISNHSQVEDYKLNVRCFNVFLRKHKQVLQASFQYRNLPENPSTPPRKRAHASASLSSDSPSPKVRKAYKVGAELTESESDDEE